MSGSRRPFVRSAVLRSVRKALPCLPEVPPSGFGYPPGGVSAPRSVEASFSSRRPWASPFRAFILPGDREEGFPSSPSAPALSRQTFPAWRWSSGGLIPPRKPCPLLLPWMFTPGRGLVLSWASRPFGLSRPKNRSRRSLSHAGIRRLFGCRLPDAILHGKRSLRSRSRTVQPLAELNFE
jgi:hypothetical protein